MWDYNFQIEFAKWLHQKKNAIRTCCLVGIRTQESYHRWRTIYKTSRLLLYHNYRWSTKIDNDVYNLYPIYDWKTNGRMDCQRKIRMGTTTNSTTCTTRPESVWRNNV